MASYKIQKANGAAPADETELAVAQALVDLESSIPELRPLVITNAKEVIHTFNLCLSFVWIINLIYRLNSVPVRRLWLFSTLLPKPLVTTRFNKSKTF